MKNILILTPYYPFPEKKELEKDTKAVYYLCKNHTEDEKITIVYYYLHRRFQAWKALPRILKKTEYKDHLYQDDMGQDVLLFEHPCLIPKRLATFHSFDKRYAEMINQYLRDKQIKPDVLVVHFPLRLTPIAQRIKAKRKVAVIHSHDVQKRSSLEKVAGYLEGYDAVGYRSKQIKQKVESQKTKYKLPNQTFITLSGVPDSVIDESNLNWEWKKDGKLRIAVVSVLNKRKNIETVIKALAELKDKVDYEMFILGDGPLRQQLEQLVVQTGQESVIHFTGRVEREKVFEYLRQSDLFVLVSFRETLGISYLEAMASGAIVIGSENRGIDGIATNEKEAFFVNPEDVHQLASVIDKVNKMDEKEAWHMKEEAFRLVQSLKESTVSREYIDNILQ